MGTGNCSFVGTVKTTIDHLQIEHKQIDVVYKQTTLTAINERLKD